MTLEHLINSWDGIAVKLTCVPIAEYNPSNSMMEIIHGENGEQSPLEATEGQTVYLFDYYVGPLIAGGAYLLVDDKTGEIVAQKIGYIS